MIKCETSAPPEIFNYAGDNDKIAVNFKDENAAQVRSKQSGELFFSLLIFPLTHCMVLLGRNAYKQCGRGSQSIPPGTRPLL